MNIIEKIHERRKTIEERKVFLLKVLPERMKTIESGINANLNEIFEANSSRKSKLFKLNRLMSEMRAHVNDISACKKGCSNCCYQRVMLSQSEANMIASNIGKSAVQLPPDYKIEGIDYYNKSTPCTFLVNNSCSIYEHRPFMCRNQVNLDIDNLLCEFENWEMAVINNPHFLEVPMLNAEPALSVYKNLSGADKHGDIRDFFPK